MIEVKNLTKAYGKKLALDGISFNVKKGEILGFLGPNGAGKSTAMNIITGFISPTDGTVLIDGCDNKKDSIKCKRKIGYLPEIPPLYTDMTVIEYLDFVYDIKKLSLDKASHISTIIDLLNLGEVKGRLIKNLSKGYSQRVGIAGALIGDCDILILDEPTVGLDPIQIVEIRNIIKELGKDKTIILSSHILSEISALCDRVLIINKGKIIAEDTPWNLSKRLKCENKFIIRVSGEKSIIEETITQMPNVVHIEPLGQKEEGAYDYIVEAKDECDIRGELSAHLISLNLPVLMIKSVDMSLEDIFMELTENYDENIMTDEHLPENAQECENAQTDVINEATENIEEEKVENENIDETEIIENKEDTDREEE